MRLKRYFWRKQALGALLMAPLFLHGAGVQTLSKDLVGGSNRDVGDIVQYKLNLACNSNTGNCGSLTISDTLPSELELVSCATPSGFTDNCTAGASSFTITKDQVFDGGDSFQITVNTRIKLGTPGSTTITNTAESTIGDPQDQNNATIQSTSDPVTVNDPTHNYYLEKKRTSPSTNLDPALNSPVIYSVAICTDSAVGNVDLHGIQFSDTFPANATVLNNGGGTVSGNTITWTIGDFDLATVYGNDSYTSKKCITKNYTLLYPDSAFAVNDTITNTLSAIDSDGYNIVDVSVTDTLGNPESHPAGSKWANDVLPGEDLNWYFYTHLRNSNAPTDQYIMYEEVPQTPAGMTTKRMRVGQWNSPETGYGTSDVQAEVFYATDSAGDCANATYTSLTNGFIPSPNPHLYYSSANNDFPTNVTCFKWVFRDQSGVQPGGATSVPSGWRMTSSAYLQLGTTGVSGPYPVNVQNCISTTHVDLNANPPLVESGPFCGTANIEEGTPEIELSKSASKTSNVKPFDTIQFTIRFRHDQADSTAPTINPTVIDFIPAEYEFLGIDSVTGLGNQPQPYYIEESNVSGTGKTKLTVFWTDQTPLPPNAKQLDGTPATTTNPASFAEGTDVYIKYTVRVKPGTVQGTYTNDVYYYDNSPDGRFTCNSGSEVDTNDIDGDGVTSETVCHKARNVSVIQAAVLGGEKWVEGNASMIPEFVDVTDLTQNAACPRLTYNNEDYTRYPCVAQTQRLGNFEYLINVSNNGNVNLDNYVLYDVLPYIGDTGVGEPLSGSNRGTAWRAELTAPIQVLDVPAAVANEVVIEYSTASDPCRNEVSASSDETGWQPGCTDDWTTTPPSPLANVTAFRIRVPFTADSWHPLESMKFLVQMSAPAIAQGSDVTNINDIHPAWNSFAHRVSFDNGNERLPTAEPRQVGIVVPKVPLNSIGSLVWDDANGNGIQDAGENGLQGAKLTLLETDGTTPVQGVAPITTGTDGTYIFTDLPEGCYVVNVDISGVAGGPYAPTGSQSTQDDHNASDSNIASMVAQNSYNSPVICLADNDEPTGTNETSAISNAGDDADDSLADGDDNGDMTVDFGFAKFGSWSGNVTEDVDNDDNGDNPIANVEIKLYSDLNCDGDMSDGSLVGTTQTDQNGDYSFANLALGCYVAVETQPAGYFDVKEVEGGTGDGDDQGSAADNNQISGKVDAGEDDSGNDFVEEKPGSWSGNVTEDIDNDDIGDNPIPGVTISLYSDPNCDGDMSDGALVGTTTTNANGDYSFDNLTPGCYIAVETQPSGYFDVTEKEGGDDNDALGTTPINTISGNVDAGLNDSGNNFVEEKPGRLCGNVSEDATIFGNGIQPIPGVTLNLYDATNAMVGTTTTDASGNYCFNNLVPGDYTVKEIQPLGYLDVSEDEGGSDNDKPDDNVLNSIQAFVAADETDASNDFVEKKPHGKITGKVTEVDENGNNPKPIPNVVLVLFDEEGNEVARTKTDENGNYQFIAMPGHYYIQEEQPRSYYDVSEDEGGADNDVNNDHINTISVVLGTSEVDIKNDFVERKSTTAECSMCKPTVCNTCAPCSATLVNGDEAIVRWKPTTNEVEYKIYVNGTFVARVDKDVTSYRLNNLESDKVYRVDVVAVSKTGSTLKQTITFKTPEVEVPWLPAVLNMMQ